MNKIKKSFRRKLFFSVSKKPMAFFARFKYATFFVKINFHEKSRYARQKV